MYLMLGACTFFRYHSTAIHNHPNDGERLFQIDPQCFGENGVVIGD
jgi:hypothetical protein